MNENMEQEASGLPLRKINWLTGGLALLFSILLPMVTGRVTSAYERMMDATETYLSWQNSAHDMEDASDYLTEQVRCFVVTGERSYMDNYFEEVNVTRRRDKALAALKRDQDVRAAEDAMTQLSIGMEESQQLMKLEIRAMRLAAAGFGYAPEDLPEEVREVYLPEEQEALPPEELVEKGRSLVFSELYRQNRQSIQQTMQRCLQSLLAARERNQTQAEEELHRLLRHQRILIFALVLMVLLLILLTTFLIIAPLLAGVSYIRAEQSIPVRGAREFRFLAQTYNRIYANNQENRKQLAYEAKHDTLTRVLNRSGYEHLLQTENLRTCTLLLVDVDKFKGINDTYGHKTGDKVLQKVASSLTENFRADDSVCRIGGDEFAVLMTRSGMENWEQIRDKITRINDNLVHPTDGLPTVSISVGVAFGNCWKTTGALDKDADLALYEVKEHGRCGVAYYG